MVRQAHHNEKLFASLTQAKEFMLIGHKYFSAEKFRYPDSARQPPSFDIPHRLETINNKEQLFAVLCYLICGGCEGISELISNYPLVRVSILDLKTIV